MYVCTTIYKYIYIYMYYLANCSSIIFSISGYDPLAGKGTPGNRSTSKERNKGTCIYVCVCERLDRGYI